MDEGHEARLEEITKVLTLGGCDVMYHFVMHE
jgi:hypothetical protein